MTGPGPIAVTGAFDDVKSRDLRFLDAASAGGALHVVLWDDATIAHRTGRPPKFPLAERRYVLESLRFVSGVQVPEGGVEPDELPANLPGFRPGGWTVPEADDTPARRAFCAGHGLAYRVVRDAELAGFPPAEPLDIATAPGRKRVVVTGCYDWFHSGHVRFFEEVSELGDLYVVAGHDANIRLLKGEGHPLFPAEERRYVVGAIRFVKQALISSGTGWMDAEPEIARIQPHRYAVNEDGDKPEKRAFCEKHGLEYVVLKRTPKPGLPRRQSTDLRGF